MIAFNDDAERQRVNIRRPSKGNWSTRMAASPSDAPVAWEHLPSLKRKHLTSVGESFVKRESRHPPILIAISWQALNRAVLGDARTRLCDCTVVILFAGFFVEANLNDLIERLGRKTDMLSFLQRSHPGLQDKLAWFYNEYVARFKAPNRTTLYRQGIDKKLRRRFPGFADLYRFRNDLAHGVVNSNAASIQKTQRVRQQAKNIVKSLFDIAAAQGHVLRPSTNYYKAIGLTERKTPSRIRLQASGAVRP